jgi:hypothetical protein
MIDYINYSRMWAWVRDRTYSITSTVRIPERDVTAQISLSKVSWDSEGAPRYAKAFIRSYSRRMMSDVSGTGVYDDPNSAPTIREISNAQAVTFELQVRANGRGAEMYGYATAMVFVHAE